MLVNGVFESPRQGRLQSIPLTPTIPVEEFTQSVRVVSHNVPSSGAVIRPSMSSHVSVAPNLQGGRGVCPGCCQLAILIAFCLKFQLILDQDTTSSFTIVKSIYFIESSS